MNQSQSGADGGMGRAPRSGPRRPERLQICLSPEERASLDTQARAGGYDSVAAYVRARTLGPQRQAP